MKILLLNDTTNWYHFGCTATSTALIEKMKALGHEVTTLSITETYKILSSPNNKKGFLNKEVLQKFENDNPKLIQLIQQHDSVVLNGEGTLHGLNPAPASLLYVAYISKTQYGKHVEILNHSPYPQHNEHVQSNSEEATVYKLVYESIDYAAVREPISLATMKKLDVTAAECFDCMPIYIKDHYQMGKVVHDPKLVLISGSATWLQINIPSSERGNIEDFTRGLGDFNRYLEALEKQDYHIRFLYGAQASPAKDDREFLEYMSKEFGRTIEVYEAHSLDDWLSAIESSSILVSGRFHHTIAAASLGTPYIALNSNTPKIAGLMQILDSSQEVIQYNDEHLFEKLSSLTTRKIQYSSRDHRDNKLAILYQKAEKNFDSLKKNDLGITLLTSSEVLENSHIYKYIFKEIISPLLPNDTSSQIDHLFSYIPQDNSYWISAHFVFTSIGFFALSHNNPKHSLFTKFSLPLISTAGYSSKLLITDLHQDLAHDRVISTTNNQPDNFLDNCLYEVALSTALTFAFSLPAALSFTPLGLSYSAFSTISSFTSSAVSCAASNKMIISLNDNNSFSAKAIPYVIDSAVAFSIIRSLSFHPVYSLPEVAMNVKKATFVLSSIVATDHITKSVVTLTPDETFTAIDSFFGFDNATELHTPEL